MPFSLSSSFLSRSMLLMITLFCHIQTTVLCFTFPALEDLIILRELHSIIYLQGGFSVICVHVLMSIADPLRFQSSDCRFNLHSHIWNLTNYIHFCCGYSSCWFSILWAKRQSLDPCVQFSLTSTVIYIFIVSLSFFVLFPRCS